jgi:2',3'-cyclic-nucleotide 2'-phosphodiesterase (5'-nucleotidase family)
MSSIRSAATKMLAASLLAIALDPVSRVCAQAAPVDLRILAINDFHGNLRPPAGGIAITDPDNKAKKITVPAGGAEHMATLVKQLRDGHSNSIFVAAGDLIGAAGGDGFTVLKEGTAPRIGVYDVDALFGYFRSNSPITPATPDRIVRLN